MSSQSRQHCQLQMQPYMQQTSLALMTTALTACSQHIDTVQPLRCIAINMFDSSSSHVTWTAKCRHHASPTALWLQQAALHSHAAPTSPHYQSLCTCTQSREYVVAALRQGVLVMIIWLSAAADCVGIMLPPLEKK